MILSQQRLGFGTSTSYILLTGVGLPLLGQALMLVGPLALYVARPRFDHLLDGLVFGAASGLGFAAAQSIIYSWLLIQGPFHAARGRHHLGAAGAAHRALRAAARRRQHRADLRRALAAA